MTQDLKNRYLTLHEFVAGARLRLTAFGWDYLTGGTETESTVNRNRLAIDRLTLRPRVLNDVSSVSARSTLFGREGRLPVLLAPVGGLETFDPAGAVAAARAAGQFGIPMMLSSVSSCPIADVRAATDHSMIYQLYVRGGGRYIEEHIEQAIELGLEAFCLTVDSAVYSRRERDIIKRFDKPWRAGSEGEAKHWQAALNWRDVERVRKAYDIPLILKGIATGEDATKAADLGVDAVYVSNHGGRQLDHCVGSIDVLPEVVQAVAGRCKVIVDGGFCRGTDIVKAIALGADAVGIARLYCFALAAAGSAGAVRMLEILEEEIVADMALLGAACLAELTPSHVGRDSQSVLPANVLGAFPLL